MKHGMRQQYDRGTLLGRFDGFVADVMDGPALLTFLLFAPAIALVAILFAVGGGVSASNQPQPPAVLLTVSEKSELLTESQAYAQATTPSGDAVLLQGIWTVGDKVSAYPYPREDAPMAAPLYSANAPYSVVGSAVMWGFLGLVLGFIIVPLSLIGYLFMRGFHYRKVNRSQELVNAAIR